MVPVGLKVVGYNACMEVSVYGEIRTPVFEHMHVGQSISQFSFYVTYRMLSSRY